MTVALVTEDVSYNLALMTDILEMGGIKCKMFLSSAALDLKAVFE